MRPNLVTILVVLAIIALLLYLWTGYDVVAK